jgi:endoglucanase
MPHGSERTRSRSPRRNTSIRSATAFVARCDRYDRGVLFRVLPLVLLVACDVARSSDDADAADDAAMPEPIDPDDVGSDEDRGAGDDDPAPVERHGALKVVGTRLYDEHDEAVQLRGVSSMWLNWEDDGYAEDVTGLRWLRNNWGLSVIRASMGVEPAGAYLADPERARAQVERMIDNAIAAGVYVIVDWHDHHAHQHQAQAVEFFADIAARYGDAPNVLYEPFNEPQQIHWSMELKPYHEAVVAAIREVDPDNIVILGTPNWSQDVERAAAAPVEGDNLMYTLHFYACTHQDWLRGKGNVAVSQGLALFVTEWGATHADGGLDGKVCLDEAARWHEWMNGHGISWTAWKFDDCEPDATCLLEPDAPLQGGWTEEWLRGHAPFVRARMQSEAPAAPPQTQ